MHKTTSYELAFCEAAFLMVGNRAWLKVRTYRHNTVSARLNVGLVHTVGFRGTRALCAWAPRRPFLTNRNNKHNVNR